MQSALENIVAVGSRWSFKDLTNYDVMLHSQFKHVDQKRLCFQKTYVLQSISSEIKLKSGVHASATQRWMLPLCGQTDACKNITFSQLRLQAVIIMKYICLKRLTYGKSNYALNLVKR